MPRKSFFDDIRTHYISPACRAHHHEECDGFVLRKEFYEHDHTCDCGCHLTEAQRSRIRAVRETNKRRK